MGDAAHTAGVGEVACIYPFAAVIVIVYMCLGLHMILFVGLQCRVPLASSYACPIWIGITTPAPWKERSSVILAIPYMVSF